MLQNYPITNSPNYPILLSSSAAVAAVVVAAVSSSSTPDSRCPLLGSAAVVDQGYCSLPVAGFAVAGFVVADSVVACL